MPLAYQAYNTLGVSHDASQEEIAASYRQLVKSCHPDRTNGDPEAAARFKRIQEAFEKVNDAKRRARYDATGDTGTDAENKLAGSTLGVLQEHLRKYIHHCISTGVDAQTKDMVKELTRGVTEEIAGMREALAKVPKTLDGLRKTAARVVVKEGGGELLSLMEHLVKEAELSFADLEWQIVVREEVLRVLKLHGFNPRKKTAAETKSEAEQAFATILQTIHYK